MLSIRVLIILWHRIFVFDKLMMLLMRAENLAAGNKPPSKLSKPS